ncbi:hypothetical protein C8R45DRAFT_517244 [Mycena sanguinolenta]|nr:hypothetical protein C8R45DRAFT_517244 [Mycena sanguinolenta]
MDVDPCTGEVSERNLLLVEPQDAAPVGLTVYRLGKVDASPATRNVGFRYTNGISVGPKGLMAGQYIQPIFTFLFPELISPGSPELPNQFERIIFLAQGSGPLEYGNYLTPPLATPPIVGQLNPWPGDVPPATTSCAPFTSMSVTSTATSSSASMSATGAPDVIQILSATTQNIKGTTTTVVIALTTSATAQLFAQVLGADNTPAEPMVPLGAGEFTLTIVTKGKPTEVIVTSSGGAASVTVAI